MFTSGETLLAHRICMFIVNIYANEFLLPLSHLSDMSNAHVSVNAH